MGIDPFRSRVETVEQALATATWGSTDLGGTIGLLHASTELRVAHWPGTPHGPGTIILVQGRAEFIEVYGEVIAQLCQRGYSVVAYDHRGQGGSQSRPGRGGHVRRYGDYVDDLAAVVRHAAALDLPRPFHVVAHSMGGLVALLAAPKLAQDVERMVLLAPLLEIAGLPAPPRLISLAAGIAKTVGLGRVRIGPTVARSTPFEANRLTSDPRRYRALTLLADANPDLAAGPPTIGWIAATLAAAARVRRRTGVPLAIPTLCIASGADCVVSTPAIDRFARATQGVGLVTIPNAQHHAFLERESRRTLVFAAMGAFLDTVEPRARRQPSRGGRTLRFEARRTAPAGPGAVAPARAEAARDEMALVAAPASWSRRRGKDPKMPAAASPPSGDTHAGADAHPGGHDTAGVDDKNVGADRNGAMAAPRSIPSRGPKDRRSEVAGAAPDGTPGAARPKRPARRLAGAAAALRRRSERAAGSAEPRSVRTHAGAVDAPRTRPEDDVPRARTDRQPTSAPDAPSPRPTAPATEVDPDRVADPPGGDDVDAVVARLSGLRNAFESFDEPARTSEVADPSPPPSAAQDGPDAETAGGGTAATPPAPPAGESGPTTNATSRRRRDRRRDQERERALEEDRSGEPSDHLTIELVAGSEQLRERFRQRRNRTTAPDDADTASNDEADLAGPKQAPPRKARSWPRLRRAARSGSTHDESRPGGGDAPNGTAVPAAQGGIRDDVSGEANGSDEDRLEDGHGARSTRPD